MDKRLLAITLILSTGLMHAHESSTPNETSNSSLQKHLHLLVKKYFLIPKKFINQESSEKEIVKAVHCSEVTERPIPKIPTSQCGYQCDCSNCTKTPRADKSSSINECDCPDCSEENSYPSSPAEQDCNCAACTPQHTPHSNHNNCPAHAGASIPHTPAPLYVHGCNCPACAGASYSYTPAPAAVHGCHCHSCNQARAVASTYGHHCMCPACTQQPPSQHHPPPKPAYQHYTDCAPEIACAEEEVCCPTSLWDSFISVDFLYWYAKETKLIYGQKFKVVNQLLDGENDSTATFVFAPKTSLSFDTDWEPGVRVGRGWTIDSDGWDFFLVWTYFANSVHETARIPGFSLGAIKAFPGFAQSGLLNPWINPSFSSMVDDEENLPFIFNKLCAKWCFRYNNIDFEIGKSFCFSPCFNLRSYTGIRASWTKTEFETRSYRNYSDNITGHTDVTFKDRFSNTYWGVGLIGGLQPNWYFSSNYSLFANIEASLIWGKMKLKKNERYKETQTFLGERINYKNDSSSDTFQLTPILDLGIGMRWDRSWCCESFRTALDIGWEQHIWFEFNQRYKGGSPFSIQQNNTLPTLTGYGELEETSSNLMYGGLTVRFRIDF